VGSNVNITTTATQSNFKIIKTHHLYLIRCFPKKIALICNDKSTNYA